MVRQPNPRYVEGSVGSFSNSLSRAENQHNFTFSQVYLISRHPIAARYMFLRSEKLYAENNISPDFENFLRTNC